MASDNEASCEGNPNFAIICAFLEKFGTQLGISNIDFSELQSMLENTHEVPKSLIELHFKLLRRIKKSAPSIDKWEKTLVRVCHMFSSKDAWEIERFGYKKSNLSCKVRVLKTLLEMQFDYHVKFKSDINKLRATELRSQPLGRDRLGHAYWFQSDENYQIRVYKEDLDDETWTLVAKDRNGLVSLINALTDGDTKIVSSDSAGNEDSNSLSEKPLLDTGQIDSKKTSPENSDVDENEKEKVRDTIVPSDIKLKDLSVLVGPKRTLEGDLIESSGDEQVKKIKLKAVTAGDSNSQATKDPIVSEAIEDPVLNVKGEGSGEDNKDDNPIVGDAVEEEVMYFFGEGNGADCQTGNEKSEENSVKDDTNKTNCAMNPVKIPLSPQKLGIVSDSKTGSPLKTSQTLKKSRWDVDATSESENDSLSELNDNNSTISSSQKKMFFFGSGSSPFKSNVFSPSFANPKKEDVEDADEKLSDNEKNIVAQKSIEKFSKDEISTASDTNNSDNRNISERTITVNKNSDIHNMQNISNSNPTELSESDKKKSINEQKTNDLILDGCNSRTDKTESNKSNLNLDSSSDKTKNSDGHSDLVVENVESGKRTIEHTESKKSEMPGSSELSTKIGRSEEKEKEQKGSSTSLDDKKKPVVEPICVKKVAYVCGTKGSDEEDGDELVTQSENIGKDSEKELKVTTAKSKNDPKETIKDELIEDTVDVKSEHKESTAGLTEDNLEKRNGVEGTKDIVLEATKRDVDDESCKKDGNVVMGEVTKTVEDTCKNSSNVAVNSKIPEVGLKEVNLTNKKKNPEESDEKIDKNSAKTPGVTPVDDDKNPDPCEPKPEIVLVTGRVTRSRRIFKEAPPSAPPTITSALRNARKKPKLPPAPQPPPTKQKMSIMDSNKKKPKKSQTLIVAAPFVPNSQIDDDEDVEEDDDDVETLVEKDPFADIEDPLAGAGLLGEDGSEEDEGDDEVDLEEKTKEKQNSKKGGKKQQKVATISSLSFDFNDSPTPTPIPVIPNTRGLRKRGRDPTPTTTTQGKKMKLKGKRQVNKSLRKSIEQKKEQQADSSSSEEEVQQKKTKGKTANYKKVEKTNSEDDSGSESPPPAPKKPKEKKNKSQRLENLGISTDNIILTEGSSVRQSRRLAQIKIKEQSDPHSKMEVNHKQEETSKSKTKGKHDEKYNKAEKRKRLKQETKDVSEPETIIEKKKKKKKEKAPSKLFNEHRPWQSSSDSDEDEEEEEEEEVIEEEEHHVVVKSDHEFSPESDVGEDNDCQPLKRARTARKESDAEDIDEFPCQKCGKSDHPEFILLCDKCENGWHCSCLRPPLLNIPEGDWFCPPCQHILLLENLQAKLGEYDKKLSKKEVEDRRKERLAYVGISLENVLPTKDNEHHKKKRRRSEGGSTSEASASSSSESESDSDEPIYQLRQRRQARSYKFNEYDEMIQHAIGDEIETPKDNSGAGNLGRGKDIATIVKDMEPEPTPPVVGENGVVRPARKKTVKKKHRKLNSLDFVSTDEDDLSDEDFKDVSTPDSDEEEEVGSEELDSEDSDDYVGKKRRKNAGPVRRSSRARTKRFDADFIDDSDDAPLKKKKKSVWDDSDSENSEEGWGKRTKKKSRRISKTKKKKKKRKNVIDDSDGEEDGIAKQKKKPRPRIQYGGLTSSEEEETGRGIRTRGKKTTYVDPMGSESEEELVKKNPRKIESDDDEDFVANEDEKDTEEEKESAEEEENGEVKEDKEEKEEKLAFVPKIYIKKPMGAATNNKKPSVESKAEQPQDKKPDEAQKKLVEEPKKELEIPPDIKKSDDFDIKKEPSVKQFPSIKPIAINRLMENTSRIGDVVVRPVTITTVKNIPVVAEKRSEVQISRVASTNASKVAIAKEDYAKQQFKMVAEKLQEIENKRKQQQEEELRGILAKKPELQLTRMPTKRGRKPKEPVVGHFSSLISNNDEDEDDDLSEPPGISLPLFQELTPKVEESPKKRRGRGPAKPKKTVEDAVTNAGGDKSTNKNVISPLKLAFDKANIEIAAPPQPFSQSSPTPSVITRMLQTKPGQTMTYPVGTIRPKQFATMPADDDIDETPPTGGPHSMGGPPQSSGHFGPGGPRRPMGVPPFRGPPGSNHYLRGMPPAHQMRGPPPGIPPHIYQQPNRPLGPSPSGGGPLPVVTEHSPAPPSQSSGSPVPRPAPPSRFPPITTPSGITLTPVSRASPAPMHMMHSNRPPLPYSAATNTTPPPNNAPPPAGYYGNYPSTGMSGGDEAMPPSAYQGSPYAEQYSGAEVVSNHSDNSNSKPYEDESGGGEFGGLVSYFSSQREDDLES